MRKKWTSESLMFHRGEELHLARTVERQHMSSRPFTGVSSCSSAEALLRIPVELKTHSGRRFNSGVRRAAFPNPTLAAMSKVRADRKKWEACEHSAKPHDCLVPEQAESGRLSR